jgi:hypothetical protein
VDIYRFFHPHHNPRLLRTPLRQQELAELLHAASELRKAVERAKQRTERTKVGVILPDHFVDLIKAIKFVETSLETLSDAHPGDSEDDMDELIQERSDKNGWEHWTMLVKEQFQAAQAVNQQKTNKFVSHTSLTRLKKRA